MLNRLQGESEFQIIINDLLEQATTVITQRNKEIMENKMMTKAEAETRQYMSDLAISKEKQKLEAESKKQETTPVSAQVSASKPKTPGNGKKRANIVKLTDYKAKIVKKSPAQKPVEETKNEEWPEPAVVKEEEPAAKFLEVS